ncbi:hypothetical protein J3B02_000358 [Coemansia erecta]|nr:hypothetical protein J3B02_000358 [Coemansia erecta]
MSSGNSRKSTRSKPAYKKGTEKPDTKDPSSKPPAVPTDTIRIANELNHQTYFIGGVKVHFPFKPYPSQLGMMNHMIKALSQSKNTMIESPTGSGKSLALLCAALAWQRDFSEKNKKRLAMVRQIIRKYVVGGASVPFLPNSNKDKVDADIGKDDPDVLGSGDVKSDLIVKPEPGARKSGIENLFETVACMLPDASATNKDTSLDTKDSKKDTGSSHLDCNSGSDSDSDFVSKKPVEQTRTSQDSQKTDSSKTAEQKDSKDSSIEYQLTFAYLKLSSTVNYIIQASEISIPAGLTEKDIDVLKDFKDNNYAQSTPRIYFGSRTHKQVSQLVEELRGKSAYRMQTAVLGSRAQTCTNYNALNSGAIDEECRYLVDENKCGPYRQYHRLSSHSRLRPGGNLEIWDIEDIVGLGKSIFACSYFAARDLAATADLVFCPYNYILDPGVREAAGIDLRDNIVILDEGHNVENAAREAGSIEITDQQLGILVSECQMLSRDGHLPSTHQFVGTFAEGLANWLQDGSDEYDYQDFDSLTAVWPKRGASVQNLFDRLLITQAFITRLDFVYSELEDFAKQQRADKEEFRVNELISFQRNGKGNQEEDNDDESSGGHRSKYNSLSPGCMRVIGGLLRVLKQMASPNEPFYRDYRIAKIRRKNTAAANKTSSNNKRKRTNVAVLSVPDHINILAFWAMNPGVIFSEISSLTRSVILTSGTLSPLNSYASELQMPFSSTLEANHVIDPSRFAAMSIEYGPSGTLLEAKYQTINMLDFQDDIGRALCSIAASCPDGMLVFAPSYSLLSKLFARWGTTGIFDTLDSFKRIYIEPQGGPKDEFETLLKSYREGLEKDRVPGKSLPQGSIMFAVYRGKVSEGIDFSDYFCRTVVNIGIPYPAFKDVKVTLKREYNDSRASLEFMHELATPDNNMLSGSLWYEIQAFRAINQALGRCLRHKNDWGAVIMLESRFSNAWNVCKLSKWIRNYMRSFRTFDDAMSELDVFYKTRIAEDEAAAAAASLSSSLDSTTAVNTPVPISEKIFKSEDPDTEKISDD